MSGSNLKEQFLSDLSDANLSGDYDGLYLKYLSKTHGILTEEMKKLPKLSPEEKKVEGPKLNELKDLIEKEIEDSKTKHQKNLLHNSGIDVSAYRSPDNVGYLHPTTQVIREMNNFFHYYGFSVGEGPEIETAEYNFRMLNLPEGHPATDLQDTLFINEPNILLRTHTSSVEARILSKGELPIRIIVPGKCYRNETANPSNSSFFHQYQGFVVDKGVTLQNLKWVFDRFLRYLYDDNIEIRFRYKYYPEVSPGMGVDIKCRFCEGKGCAICKQRGWIEVLGSGMIHLNTLKMCGINPDEYTGFAFGMGLDRLVMAKFGIPDVRKLYGGLTYL